MLKIKKISTGKLLIISIPIILFMVVVFYLYHTWHRPLGPSLNLTKTPEQEKKAANLSARNSALTNTTATGPESNLEAVCGGPPSMMILVAGVGSKNFSAGPADAIYLVRMDFQARKVSVLYLSPDLWVAIPAVEDHGIKKGRLNQAYLFGTEKVGFYNGKGRGSELLALTLQENFGLQPNHYIALDLKVFRDIVNEVGGIEVHFPRDLNLKLSGEDGLVIKAGFQSLNGRQAEKVVRARIKDDDYSRLENQIMVLKALTDKTLTSNSLKELTNLVNFLLDKVKTDLSPSEIKKIICLTRKIDPEKDITYLHLPRKLLTKKRIRDEFLERKIYAYTWDKDSTRRLINNFQTGGLPQ
ncbi:MAG: LCP family protein [Thermodesulfobacteriota bacterium]